MTPPNLLACFVAALGSTAASAAITAHTQAGSTDTDRLIAAMEKLSFETPKGKMTFRKEDHQVLQDMYHWRIVNGGKPELVGLLAAADLPLAVFRRR